MTVQTARYSASSRSCVTISVVFPNRRSSSRSIVCISARVSGSSAPNGSSIRNTLGSPASARASPALCRCPPLNCQGYRAAKSSPSPTNLPSSQPLGQKSSAPRIVFPPNSNDIPTFRSMLMCGNNPVSWITCPIPPPQSNRVGPSPTADPAHPHRAARRPHQRIHRTQQCGLTRPTSAQSAPSLAPPPLLHRQDQACARRATLQP